MATIVVLSYANVITGYILHLQVVKNHEQGRPKYEPIVQKKKITSWLTVAHSFIHSLFIESSYGPVMLRLDCCDY